MRLPTELSTRIKVMARRLKISENEIILFGLKQHVELLENTYNQITLKNRQTQRIKKAQ